MHILLTNDDGIDSPWLSALTGAFAAQGHETTVVAPAGDQSGTSGALTPVPIRGQTELSLRAAPDLPAARAWAAVGASPSVCVVVGLALLAESDSAVGLVVSGPNFGWNLGRDIWRSGTVWAAITAWSTGLPALAVSGAPVAYPSEDLDGLTGHAVSAAGDLLARSAPEVWNLNVPAPPARSWKGVRWTPNAPAERLTQSTVETVARDGEGLTVRISQRPDLRVPVTDDSDAAWVQAGGVALGRLRPPEATAGSPDEAAQAGSSRST